MGFGASAPFPRPGVSSAAPLEEGPGEAFGGGGEPGLGDQFLEVGDGDAVEAGENRGVAVEVRGGEVEVGLVGQQGVLGEQVLDPGAEDRAVGGISPSASRSAVRSGRSQTKSFLRTRQARLP